MCKDTKYTVKYTETFIQFVLLVIKKKNAGKKTSALVSNGKYKCMYLVLYPS